MQAGQFAELGAETMYTGQDHVLGLAWQFDLDPLPCGYFDCHAPSMLYAGRALAESERTKVTAWLREHYRSDRPHEFENQLGVQPTPTRSRASRTVTSAPAACSRSPSANISPGPGIPCRAPWCGHRWATSAPEYSPTCSAHLENGSSSPASTPTTGWGPADWKAPCAPETAWPRRSSPHSRSRQPQPATRMTTPSRATPRRMPNSILCDYQVSREREGTA